jgi:hypothetical protein
LYGGTETLVFHNALKTPVFHAYSLTLKQLHHTVSPVYAQSQKFPQGHGMGRTILPYFVGNQRVRQ